MTLAPRVLIIGAGFSGVALAANLLRQNRPVHVLLASRFGPIGRGVAYQTRLEAHVLNVPAGQMSVFPDEPDGFLRFARERDPGITAETFLPRRLYGEYLERVLADAEARAPERVVLERLIGEACSLDVDQAVARVLSADGRVLPVVQMRFADGRILASDHVALALGNYSPADLPIQDPRFFESSRYVRDPWIRGSLDVIDRGEPVLMIGTGLTTMDIALDLRARGIHGPFHAVSRHGLLPRPHRDGAGAGPAAKLPAGFSSPSPATARGLMHQLRAAVAANGAEGRDWRSVLGAARPLTPFLWKQLDLRERARFLRHVRPWWDVHRHRAAPETARAIERMREQGELRVRAGRILALAERGDGVDVRLRPRGGSQEESLRVARVVNCTGPSTDARRLDDRLIGSLREAGLIRPDPLGLGLEADADGALLDAAGRPSPVLSLVGPLLKARDWEATAVPELRDHAFRLATRLLGIA